MKKRKVIFVAICAMFMLVMFGCAKQNVQVNDFEAFKEAGSSDIVKIDIQECTEGGVAEKTITDKPTIQKTFDKLCSMKIIGTSNLSCEDNTISYKFYYSDGHTFSLSVEDKTLIIGKERYLIE